MLFRLKIVAGPAAGRSIDVDRSAIIGRSEADVELSDPAISRRHAALRVEGGRLSVEDLGSTNGTFVNGLRIATSTPLGPGDVVKVGTTSFEIEATEPVAVVTPPLHPEPVHSTEPLPVAEIGGRGNGSRLIAGALVVVVGLGAAAFVFNKSEGDDPNDARSDKGRRTEAVADEGPPACAVADRKTRGVRALRPGPRSPWHRRVTVARRARGRALAVLVASGVADDAKVFLVAFRRTDSSLLRLQRALNLKRKWRQPARRSLIELRRRARFEVKAARRAGLDRCGALALD